MTVSSMKGKTRASRGSAIVASGRELTQEERKEISLHEAGHAVVAIALGLPVYDAEVFQHVDSHGGAGKVSPGPGSRHVRELPPPKPRKHDPWFNKYHREDLAKSALQNYAGVAAGDPVGGGGWHSVDVYRRSTFDREVLEREAAHWGWSRPAARMCSVSLRRARSLVDVVWGPLVAVAEALHERGRLMGDEIRDIVSVAPYAENWKRDPLFWPTRARDRATALSLAVENLRDVMPGAGVDVPLAPVVVVGTCEASSGNRTARGCTHAHKNEDTHEPVRKG